MANSQYEYVKRSEVDDPIFPGNFIVVLLDGRNFRRFSEVQEFVRPNDEKALKLMNSCATAVLEEYPDIVFSYGFSDEYSFVFKKKTEFYQRRASKILSLVVSFFTSVYATKWNEFFPLKEMRHAPSFHGRVIQCASIEILQEYLAWRQNDCHISNQFNTCLWKLIECGKTEDEARVILKGTQKQEKNELLKQHFGINYKEEPEIFRQGSCVFKTQVEDIVKHREDGTPIKRLRRKIITVHSKSIVTTSFWNEHQSLLTELGGFTNNISKINPDCVRSFLFENQLTPFNWTVIRIDGCHFHRFSEVHDFEKPNDKHALDLMNKCAMEVLEEFQDVTFSYGVSDEYSFVLKKNSQLYQRRANNIVSAIVSFFSSTYVMNWKAFFPKKKLKYPPTFDGRAVCYPSEIIRHYLAWRQVDCHINNQYNTCFWMLVKSGKSKIEAQNILKGTQAQEKNELLTQQFGIDYTSLPEIFRQGSSVFRIEVQRIENGTFVGNFESKITLEYCNIIEQSFWEAHPSILES